MKTTTTPRPALLATGVAVGVLLAIGAPLAASAHVHVDPADAAAGATSTLTFSFSHGCDDSPTTALVIDVPDAVSAATPIAQGGWTITRELGDDGLPTRLTYTADRPIESGIKASVSLDALFADDAADTSVAFPVTQTCVVGETAWIEVAADGEDAESLDSPAPLVAVGAVAEDADEHGHGGAADYDGAAASAEPVAAATTTVASDPLALALGGAGLLAGVAALIVTLVRTRRP